MLTITTSGRSDVGLKRSNNEDAFIIKPELGFVALADGMGGAAFGETASKIFIDTALEVFSKVEEQSEKVIYESVQKSFGLTNERILNYAKKRTSHQGMGCTAELLAFCNQSYFVGHVGDSRTYLFRKGELRQITRDHSLIQEQIEKGLITPDQAKSHSLRNVILRAIGTNETLAVDLIKGKGTHGDIFLVCSDGLTDMVNDISIQDVLSTSVNPDQKIEKLIDLAKSAGGYDNITVILCEVSG
jgi:serine/threonine protein phosphatase PrpC